MSKKKPGSRVRKQIVSLTYSTWKSAKQRCYNPNDKGYKGYGGRGIVMCDEWRLDYNLFFLHMGPKPPGMSLDRINNDGNYEPGNCRWATPKEQAANKRSCVYLTAFGKTQCLMGWARETGIQHTTLYYRLFRHGWGLEKSLTAPVRKRNT